MPPRSNTKEFIEKSTKVHNGRFDYSKVEYVGCQTKVTIICEKHGEFSVTPASHLQGTDCPRCKGNVYYTVEDFIKSSKDKFGDFLDYSEVGYTDSQSPVKLICPIHGEFSQTPISHLQAKYPCPTCGKDTGNRSKTKTTEDFVRRAKEIHGDRYDYSLTNYVNCKTKVDIICKEDGHGVYSQSVFAHLRKSGCPVCARHNTSWTKTNWFNSAMKSVNFDSFKVYLLEIEGNGEKFYKIGKTFRESLSRISDIGYDSNKKYFAKEICSLNSPDNSKNSSDMIFDIENYCHRCFKKYSYKPKLHFGGHTECFSYIPDDFDFLNMAINLPTELPTLN